MVCYRSVAIQTLSQTIQCNDTIGKLILFSRAKFVSMKQRNKLTKDVATCVDNVSYTESKVKANVYSYFELCFEIQQSLYLITKISFLSIIVVLVECTNYLVSGYDQAINPAINYDEIFHQLNKSMTNTIVSECVSMTLISR